MVAGKARFSNSPDDEALTVHALRKLIPFYPDFRRPFDPHER